MARTVSSSAFFWERVRLILRSWLPGFFVGACLLIGLTYAIFIRLQFTSQDTANSPLQHSSGVVSLFRPGMVASSRYGGGGPDEFSITLDKAPDTYCTYTPYKAMQIGQRVQVTYRTGKSGRIYIIDAEPIGK